MTARPMSRAGVPEAARPPAGGLRRWPVGVLASATTALVAAGLAALAPRLDGAIAIGLVLGLAVGMAARPRRGLYGFVFVVLVADLHLWDFSPATERLGFYVFNNWWRLLSPAGERQFGFLVASSVDVGLLALAAGLAGKAIRRGRRPVLRPETGLGLLYLAVLAVMFGYGLLGGGQLKPALWQVRPFAHFVVLAVVGAGLLRRAEHVRALVWWLAAATLIKAGQIVWIFAVEAAARFGQWREILGHEDSVFLAAVLVLALALGLYGAGGAQRRVLLAGAPLLLAGVVMNFRRAAWVALGLSLLLAPLLLPGRRRAALRVLAGLALIFGLYAGVAWTLPDHPAATPLHKLVSIVAPPPGSLDHTSNLYRVKENYNLRRTIAAHPLGLGFGHPFEVHLPLPDISFLLPLWQYHPHNMILGVWMSLGSVGFVVFLTYMGSLLMLAAASLRRQPDPYLKAVSYFALTALISALLVGALDQFIWLGRGTLFLGAVAALTSTLARLAPAAPDGRPTGPGP